MDLRKLRYFQAIVEAGSLHRASERLRVAQPALSKSVRALEDSLGAPLLIRHSKGVETTEEGATLYRHAAEILRAWRAAEADVREQSREPGGTVSIGAPPTLAHHLFGRLSSEVAAVYPKLRFEFYEGVGHHLWQQLHAERLDIGILGHGDGSDSIIAELVAFEDVFLLAPADHPLPPTVEGLEEIAGHPLVITTRAATGRSWFEEMTRQEAPAFDVRYRVESPQVAKELVERRLGLAILPASGVLSELGRGRFRIVRIAPLKLPRVLACRKERYLHPSVAFTRTVLRRLLRELSAGERAAVSDAEGARTSDRAGPEAPLLTPGSRSRRRRRRV
ncbi:LysR family transcriptional regulator, nitrogen assimilation regulatory protein [Tistlia consotensis]|uniref:LysR family transcriptional regulator, nitrogen assimilation regulatory protein n=1 Tax=Tistlia consotensis USBA 355 TaxID=560819 RepID=A0A1Y6C0B9_9PROT|nr:LysR family transcriptional regulator [Tistlia consotensis]SMF36939.1 LysR family transcriptional regulator, nitrogen assimilation regulatory protein [Tistlia consotensis USBA 355]SNR72367.1 LysR family transcriptional regulator, nitrogen assimilation regulatory protein [Tistlia consotensis]